jgi:cysteine synthase
MAGAVEQLVQNALFSPFHLAFTGDAMKVENILQTIGNTPHVRINRLFGAGANVWVKSERSNPGGSIKDRIALSMVEDAEKSGALKPGGTIIEPTSGNTGIGLALVAAVKGYKLILVMPDSMSIERRRLMLAYGAQFDLTPREKGMKGANAGLVGSAAVREPGQRRHPRAHHGPGDPGGLPGWH